MEENKNLENEIMEETAEEVTEVAEETAEVIEEAESVYIILKAESTRE